MGRAVSPSPELVDPSRIDSCAFPDATSAELKTNECDLFQRQVELGSISHCQFSVADRWIHTDLCGATAANLSTLLMGSTPMAVGFHCIPCRMTSMPAFWACCTWLKLLKASRHGRPSE